MPYIGTDINYGNLAKQTGTGDGADTTPIAALTYTVPSSESILVFLDGVCQVPSTDFTATGTTLTFTTAPANGVAILVMFLGRSLDIGTPADNTVTNAKMANNAIDSAELVAGSVDLAHMSSQSVDEDNLHISNAGSNGDFLSKQSGDAGGLTWAAAGGGAWVLIGSSTASTSASLDQTGLDSTYDTYAIVLSDIVPTTDSALPAIRFGDSGGFDSGASDYAWHASYGDNTSGSYGGTISSGETFIRLGNSVGSAAGEGIGGVFFLSRPGDGTARPMLHGTFAGIGTSSGTPVFGGNLVAIRLAVITLDRVQFLFTSGNVGTGRMSVYGLAHA